MNIMEIDNKIFPWLQVPARSPDQWLKVKGYKIEGNTLLSIDGEHEMVKLFCPPEELSRRMMAWVLEN